MQPAVVAPLLRRGLPFSAAHCRGSSPLAQPPLRGSSLPARLPPRILPARARNGFPSRQESAGQTGDQPILTLALGGRGGRELGSRLDLEKLLDVITFLLAISFYIIAKLGFFLLIDTRALGDALNTIPDLLQFF